MRNLFPVTRIIPGFAVNLLPLPVLRERAGVRVISSTNEHRNSKTPSPQPSPGVPGEGAEDARAIAARRGTAIGARMPTVLDARVVTGTGGGPEKTILNSPRFLKDAGYRMLCAYLHSPEDSGFKQLQEKALLCGAPLFPVADHGPCDLGIIPRLLQICKREQVRIWHGHDYKSNLLGLLLRPFWSMRLVTTVHGWVTRTRRTPLYYAIDRKCLPYYDAVLCVSQPLRDQCVAAGVAERRCLVLENGIDTQDCRRTMSQSEARQRLGLPSELFLVGAVGRLSAEKGFDVLIRSVDSLVREGLHIGLVIAGEGDQRPELKALIATLGQEHRIQLLGYQSDPSILYQAMDVFALSSLREGLPNVLLEAMAMQLPVVSTRVGGIDRLIRNGENGLLVSTAHPDAMAAAIRHLLEDDALRARLGNAARQTVEVDYSFAHRIQRLSGVYDNLLSCSTKGDINWVPGSRSHPPFPPFPFRGIYYDDCG
jgi:glycosyltransferase involved in cell wall biosynthesis